MKRPTQKETQRPAHTCSECVFATIDDNPINRHADDGRPFMLRCKFTPWKVFFHTSACDRFMPTTPKK